MSQPIIELLVAPDGSVKIETVGFAGSSCLNADRFLRDALGDVSAEETKPEYYAASRNGNFNLEIHSSGEQL
ncbi:MAG: DUF2997 domain-containing protein [Pirellulales bacterium]